MTHKMAQKWMQAPWKWSFWRAKSESGMIRERSPVEISNKSKLSAAFLGCFVWGPSPQIILLKANHWAGKARFGFCPWCCSLAALGATLPTESEPGEVQEMLQIRNVLWELRWSWCWMCRFLHTLTDSMVQFKGRRMKVVGPAGRLV